MRRQHRAGEKSGAPERSKILGAENKIGPNFVLHRNIFGPNFAIHVDCE